MRKLITLVALAAMLVVAVPAAHAASGVPYKGKTTGGHKVTFRYVKGKAKIYRVVTGIPMTCLSIQGGGSPMTGVDSWTADWLKVPTKNLKVTESSPTGVYYNEVEKHHTINVRRAGGGAISGSIRVQFSFLIPKYPIGTFQIYSCLGNVKFRAKPAR